MSGETTTEEAEWADQKFTIVQPRGLSWRWKKEVVMYTRNYLFALPCWFTKEQTDFQIFLYLATFLTNGKKESKVYYFQGHWEKKQEGANTKNLFKKIIDNEPNWLPLEGAHFNLEIEILEQLKGGTFKILKNENLEYFKWKKYY
jgi:hypothetical protein